MVKLTATKHLTFDTNRNQTLMTTIPAWTMGIKIQLYTALCPHAKYATTPEKSITQLKGPNQGPSRYESRYKNSFNANKRLEAWSLLYKLKKLLKQGTHFSSHFYTFGIDILVQITNA